METPGSGNGWEAWGKHVLKEQERQDICIKDQEQRIKEMEIGFGLIKAKVATIGFLLGIAGSILASVIYNAIAK